jgi:hypothetical protein
MIHGSGVYYRRNSSTVLVRAFMQYALLRDCEQEVRVYASLLKFVSHLLKDIKCCDNPFTGLHGKKF